MTNNSPRHSTAIIGDAEKQRGHDEPVHVYSLRILLMATLVSMGGLIFGYDTGQISGFLEMDNFLQAFGDTTKDGSPAFSNSRSGTIVGLLSIGTLIGALAAAPIADGIGRKLCITTCCIVFCVGNIVQIATDTHWYQIAVGRLVAGLGVGGLSVLTPMYQAETAPRQVRGAMISCYQLFITLGIFVADCVNFGTEKDNSSRAWKLPMGIAFIWPAIMGGGILLFRESPRWDYRKGRVDQARHTIALSYGVSDNHWEVNREMGEIKRKFDLEQSGSHKWYEIFTAPAMTRRTLIGVIMQMLQQLTGANFFFYYGTTIFTATGLSNSYVTAMILGAVNFGTTFGGLYVVEHFGRRHSLIVGGLWMFVCFLIFASVGHFALDQSFPQNTPQAGAAMIVFACLFIAGFAMTWGPLVWTVVGEIYPTRYRAKCMGLATASNWIWNFLISFFTPYITTAIDYRYGYVFASMCFAGAVFVYFFVCESQGRTLEEIDTMYIMGVLPMKSKNWVPPEDGGPTMENSVLEPGATTVRKEEAQPAPGQPTAELEEEKEEEEKETER
ncbi:general substrate transporter [Rhizodiscina lignyota]|uniref:General substrate transporter n=1 Tax=Rhizodiscina lignyota TaxID=1504668 RepID=A0A9P4M894_9PEZI|nr:general substrate transporter [Rhizodiscina lignyota]